MTRPILQIAAGFARPVVDKVERLLEVLNALRQDSILGDAFALHGGTALNLFHDEAPRLSVDIDLLFIAEPDLEAMRLARPKIDVRFRRVVENLGYRVQGTNHEHSGQTYRVQYPGDYLKVDISYLARVPLLPPEVRCCAFADPETCFPTLQLPELIAGKIKALLERVAARDLYDLWRLARRLPDHFADPLARACAIYAVGASDRFPYIKSPAESLELFEQAPADFVEPLLAMLAPEEAPDYDDMLREARSWLMSLNQLEPHEAEYFQLLDERSVFRPELLFASWPDVLQRARLDPVMRWKVQNLACRGTSVRPKTENGAAARS